MPAVAPDGPVKVRMVPVDKEELVIVIGSVVVLVAAIDRSESASRFMVRPLVDDGVKVWAPVQVGEKD